MGRKPKAEDDRHSRNCIPIYISKNRLRKLGLEKREVGPLLKAFLDDYEANRDNDPTSQKG